MWRAYTREKPARQGLALIIVAVSSALVAVMAGSVIQFKSTPLLALEDAAPANWPITFKVPPDFEETTAIRPRQLDSGLVSVSRRVIFKNRTDATCRIGVGHRSASEANSIMDVAVALADRAASDGKETVERSDIPTINPEWLILKKSRADSVTYCATLEMPDRSVVLVVYATASPSTKDRRLVAAVCNSVAPRDGKTDSDD